MAQITYTLERVGLTGPGYTNASTGMSITHLSGLTAAGEVIGDSRRFNGSTSAGSAIWAHSQGSSREIGLTGTGYVQANTGYAYAQALGFNRTGLVIGLSQRYNQSRQAGWDTWLYDQVSTRRVGPQGKDFTSSRGYAEGFASGIDDAGEVLGYSNRYRSNQYFGRVAWIDRQGVVEEIGPTGTDYTASNGFRDSTSVAINSSGQAIGVAALIDGLADAGRAGWIYSHGRTQRIGLMGPDFSEPGAEGNPFTQVTNLNEAGQVIGSSAFTTEYGFAAWIYSEGTTRRIGLIGKDYSYPKVAPSSVAYQINNVGQVVGVSRRNGINFSCWLYSQGKTKRVGLAMLAKSEGWVDNTSCSIGPLNDAGQALGVDITNRFGNVGWLYTRGRARRIGLTGQGYVNPKTGHSQSSPRSLNQAGQVVGVTARYNGPYPNGSTAWFYDDRLRQIFPLEFSVRSSDGYAESTAEFLGEDGLVLGTYAAFSGNRSLGKRAFSWTPTGGMQDLGQSVEGGLEPDWRALALAVRSNAAGQIVGFGGLSVGGHGAFLLTPIR